ncbi:putative RNA polymerase III subunit RPC82-domain-containing protein [Seiridium cardinale]
MLVVSQLSPPTASFMLLFHSSLTVAEPPHVVCAWLVANTTCFVQTKNAAELCVLLIEELYGQLPSRIFDVLLSKGRANVKQLGQDTSMTQRLVRHALAVLIQQNLIFHHTDSDTLVTRYEADPGAAYNLVRTGKILDAIHRGYGEEARDLVHQVMLNGHMSVSALMQLKSHGRINGTSHTNGHTNGASSETSAMPEDDYDRSQRTFDLLAHLIAVGILEPLTMRMLQTPEDMRAEIERDLMKDYPSGLRGTKQKNEFNAKSKQAWQEVLDESKDLKRRLEPDYLSGSAAKRRKLANGSRANGFSSTNRDEIIEPDTILHVNYKKCTVELRNHRLSQFAEDAIGPVTAQVYAAMLSALGKKISHCQLNTEDQDGDVPQAPSVTTLEIYEHLKPSADVFAGIGKCEPDAINSGYAEKVQRTAPGYDADEDLNGPISDGDDDGANGDVHVSNGIHTNGHHEQDTKVVHSQNGTRETKVKFAERIPTKAERIQQMRQHLLILAESNLKFVRHCGTRDHGEWTVDFELLVPKLQLIEIDALIEESFGRQGLRLIRILRSKGKIDDRTLPGFALMKKSDVYLKMTEMELQGFLEVQEVPRDNNRTASRTLFLWFFDKDRTMTRVLDDTYKAMARHLQRLEVERRKKRNVLSVVERKDVQGMEEEKLRGDVYNEYREFLDIESKLLSQVARLDDLVGVFRDF